MEKFYEIIDIVAGADRALGLTLLALLLVLAGVELYYWLGRYGRISKYRNRKRHTPSQVDGISVVVILGDDFHYLENTVPKIMGQQYPDFELVVVELSASPEFSDELELLKVRYPNLVSARLDPDPRFRISNKMIYNVGIKTAHYNNIILTTPDAYPVSPKWLDFMARGFENSEVIVAYCGLEQMKGIGNGLMRCGRFMVSVRYLASAIAGRPYRGILQNLGFNKQLYLANRGFNHLDMTIGEDDLFVQKIADDDNTSIIINPHAAMRQTMWGGFGAWWRSRRLLGTARRYYPRRAKWATTAELCFRFMFMLTAIACAVLLPLYTGLGAVALIVRRAFVVRHQTRRISKRVGETGLGNRMMLYDLIEPFVYMALSVSRWLKPPQELWK